MSEHELEKLLGGFAADTLTTEERKLLYSAVLQDQELFNAMADEQALKELLADPIVRRRLLQALHGAGTSRAGGSLSWLDWFKRPSSLALAGGLATAIFAVVLGTKVYQDSLRQAAQSVATENNRPATPPASAPPASQPAQSLERAPQPKAKENATSPLTPAKKVGPQDKLVKQERPAPSKPQDQQASGVAPESAAQQRDRGESRVAALGESAEESTALVDGKIEADAATARLSEPTQSQQTIGGLAADAISPAAGARALFYGVAPSRLDSGMRTQEKEEAKKSLSESAPRAMRPKRQLDQFSAIAGKSADSAARLTPLGLRYSFAIRGADGQELEVDAATASREIDSAWLAVETNQDSYIQVWEAVGSSTPLLLFPAKDSGKISIKLMKGQRQQIRLSGRSEPFSLNVRLSRVPFGPITRQEAALFGRVSPNQIQESLTTGDPTGSKERATYVVSQDPSPTAQLTVEIAIGAR